MRALAVYDHSASGYNHTRETNPLEAVMRRALMLVVCGAFVVQPALAFKTYDVTLKMSRAES